eukprot:TRINITY_DN460_c0_g9_i2.p1 TRINITY_DN460_c0_g9~~TRINITY_DN460_c0_g9_i2.p1  ORF type:complete len:296 (+),score=33.68 TRINITY_DN460_c0_g9_i2:246-1133(+)
MLETKEVMCGGNQNFVIQSNKNLEMMSTVVTESYAKGNPLTVEQMAAYDVVNRTHLEVGRNIPKYAYLASDRKRFSWMASASMKDFTTQGRWTNKYYCWDIDKMPSAWRDHNFSFAYLQEARRRQGESPIENCTDVAKLCDEESGFGNLARFVCPKTCKCQVAHERLFLRTPAGGCPSGCFDPDNTKLGQYDCKDMPPDDEWKDALEDWFVSYAAGMQKADQDSLRFYLTQMKRFGCNSLYRSISPLSSKEVCPGGDTFKAFATRCPVACRCRKDPTIPGCPKSCRTTTTTSTKR